MMQTLIFATNNKNKVEEIRAVLEADFEIKSLQEAGIAIDIPEPYDTLEENATEKSTTIYQLTKQDCFSEDTGLEVTALNGAPGAKSARYAGEEGDSKKNIDKILSSLLGIENRAAQFKTVISLMLDGKEYQFKGICKGTIAHEIKGSNGFGYDPIFIPEGSNLHFGEMTLDEKNKYSHRKKATSLLVNFLKEYHG